ncbi:MAG: RluA family pseudouridine synthase [Firmicutes bacterium]|nr:RluA family pseudouridine synthase [Bacillota bacterium]
MDNQNNQVAQAAQAKTQNTHMKDLIILHEDNHIIVAVKPQNIPSQEDSTGDMDMLTLLKNYLIEKYNKQGNAFLGLVHRLDRPTGGLMVFAKTSKAAARLSEQMRDHKIEKRYLAVGVGRLKDPIGRLVNYLQKNAEQNKVVLTPAMTEGAKLAELDYRVLEVAGSLSLIDVKLITGRGHQARVQLMAAGAPIYGDTKYGARQGAGQNLSLWAYSLKFAHPITAENLIFKVFPPETAPWDYFAIAKHINVARPE